MSKLVESIDGVKRARISVLLDSSEVNHRDSKLVRSVAELMRANEALVEGNAALRRELIEARRESDRRLERSERLLKDLPIRSNR